jgi:hypothetical protein
VRIRSKTIRRRPPRHCIVLLRTLRCEPRKLQYLIQSSPGTARSTSKWIPSPPPHGQPRPSASAHTATHSPSSHLPLALPTSQQATPQTLLPTSPAQRRCQYPHLDIPVSSVNAPSNKPAKKRLLTALQLPSKYPLASKYRILHPRLRYPQPFLTSFLPREPHLSGI